MRLKKKLNENEFQKIKDVLWDSDVKTEEHLRFKYKGMIKSALMYSSICIFIAVLFILLLPKYSAFTILILCIYAAWLWSSILLSKQYFKRYLEELEDSKNTIDNIE